MWVFSVLFLIGLLITIIGLFMLIPKKTRNKGKKILTYSIIVTVFSYGIAKIVGPNIPNAEPGTITKAQYQQLKEGMTKDNVRKIVGDPYKDDSNLDEWDYKGINGITKDSTVSLFFYNDTVSSIIDDGLTHKIKSNNVSTVLPDKTNDDYADYVKSDIENAIGSKVDWAFDKKVNTVKNIEVNDNLGKKDGSKLILVYLNAPVTGTNNAIKNLVNEDTLKIAKAIKEDNSNLDFDTDSITYFWYLPLTDNYGKTQSSEAFKISLDSGTLQKIDFNNINDVNLPAIADQYNVLFKE